MTDFTMTTDKNGVALITWDVAAKSMNVMSLDGFALLDSMIDEALADDAVSLRRRHANARRIAQDRTGGHGS